MSQNLQSKTAQKFAEGSALVTLIENAVNEAYINQSSCAARVVADTLRSTYIAEIVHILCVYEISDGQGGYSAEISLSLTDGSTTSTIVSHSNLLSALYPRRKRKPAILPASVLADLTAESLSAALEPLYTNSISVAQLGKKDTKGKEVPAPESVEQYLKSATAIRRATQYRLTQSISFVRNIVFPVFQGIRIEDQTRVDRSLQELDQNCDTILAQMSAGISIVCAKGAARLLRRTCYEYIDMLYRRLLPENENPHMEEHGLPNPGYFSIPDLVITVFSCDPRCLGKLRVRQVLLVVHLASNGCNTVSGNNILTIETLERIYRIIETAEKSVATLVAGLCENTLTPSDVHETFPVNTDGSLLFTRFYSLEQAVEVLVDAIKQVGAIPGVEFSVGFAVDGAYCYSPKKLLYSFVQGEEDISGDQLAIRLFSLIEKGSQNLSELNLVSYLEDTHYPDDFSGMQRLLYMVLHEQVQREVENRRETISAKQPIKKTIADPKRKGSGREEKPVEEEKKQLPYTINPYVIISGMNIYNTECLSLEEGARSHLTNHATLRIADEGTVSSLLARAAAFRSIYPGSSVGVSLEVCEGDPAFVAQCAVGIHARTLRINGIHNTRNMEAVNELLKISNSLKLSMLWAPSFDCRKMMHPSTPKEIRRETPVLGKSKKMASKK